MIFVVVAAFSSVYVVWRKLKKQAACSGGSSAGLLLMCLLVALPGMSEILPRTRSMPSRFSMAYQQNSPPPGAYSRTQANRAGSPASGQEALRALRRIFAELGYQDVRGPQGVPVRFVTDIKDYQDCELVIRERMFFSPGWSYGEVYTETTFLSLAELDADEIRAAKISDDSRFPAGSWSVDVSAAGPAIRVQIVRSFGEQESDRKELKPDVVHFYLRYQAQALEAARAIQVLARACGAK